jgi:chaperonin GroEL
MEIPAKKVVFGEAARGAVMDGAKQLYDGVRVTMGLSGRRLLIEEDYGIRFTMDGIGVAREIDLEDKEEEMGVCLLREAANKTNMEAGDGTTTATVLTYKMMDAGIKEIQKGRNAIAIKEGMDIACEAVVGRMLKDSIKADGKEDYFDIAKVASRDDEIAKTISDLMEKLGKDGVIVIEPGQAIGLNTQFTEGLQYDNGYLSPYFMTSPDGINEMENPYILLLDDTLTDPYDMLPIMQKIEEEAAKEGKPFSILVIAHDVVSGALTTLVANKMKNICLTCAVRAPFWGERQKEALEDLAVVTGGKVIMPEANMHLKDMSIEMLGRCKKVITDRETCTIYEGGASDDDVDAHIKSIRERMERGEPGFEHDKLEERIARLKHGIAIVKVGGATETEAREKLDRVEDALGAVKSAAQEGIVPGAGTSLINASISVDDPIFAGLGKDELVGVKIVMDALPAVCQQIAENCGVNGEHISLKVGEAEDPKHGFSAKTKDVVDLFEAKVINAVKVEKCALKNATSIAGMFLTTEGVITRVPQKPQA